MSWQSPLGRRWRGWLRRGWFAVAGTLPILIACAGQVPPSDVASGGSTSTLDADELLRAGRRFARGGDSVRAEHYLVAALERGAAPERVVPWLVAVCIEGSRLRAALGHAETHLRTHPEDAPLRFLVATLYLGLERPREARLTLEGLLRRRPDHARARYLLGALLAPTAPAITAEHFTHYLALEPRGPHAAEVRAWLRDRSSATPELALPLEPTTPPETPRHDP